MVDFGYLQFHMCLMALLWLYCCCVTAWLSAGTMGTNGIVVGLYCCCVTAWLSAGTMGTGRSRATGFIVERSSLAQTSCSGTNGHIQVCSVSFSASTVGCLLSVALRVRLLG